MLSDRPYRRPDLNYNRSQKSSFRETNHLGRNRIRDRNRSLDYDYDNEYDSDNDRTTGEPLPSLGVSQFRFKKSWKVYR